MPRKEYPNGVVIHDNLTRFEMAAYQLRHPSGGSAPIPSAASMKSVRSITVRPDDPTEPSPPPQTSER
jgi:hypothetical protein